MEENYVEEKELLDRYRNGLCSQEEELLVDNWFNQQSRLTEDYAGPVSLEIRNEIWSKLPASAKTVTVKLWPRITAAASIVLVLFAAILFYNRQQHSAKFVYKNDVSPGKIGATLTLADGRKIKLDDVGSGQLAREAGIGISKSSNGQLVYEIKKTYAKSRVINSLATGIGETYKLRLPDGSMVWLNAASSLTYSANLKSNGERSVELTGEGYFEVSKDKRHPFIVRTSTQEVEVLGTHFNINSYPGESAVATTLLEGVVKVSSGSFKQWLKPGEQALNNGIAIKVATPDVEAITDWKDGDFIFDSENFESIIQKIERWYDVTFIYKKGAFDKIRFSGRVSRSKPLSSVLNALKVTGGINFEIEGRRVIVM